ncbi:regulatory protein RecX [Zobellella maritima]|uniref:regulatory protein RecX n=1 Tax=Zobellella maritima TaxID=2059725 RepID=UPI000E301EBF|nr:regulatory protein RecX [Zobellella maritima]
MNDDLQQVWDSALRLLSRREHSRRELMTKLRRRQFPEPLVSAVLERLEQQNWLQDSRFAALLVRQQVLKKHGPMRIRAELMHKGVAQSLGEQALAEAEVDWFELARTCYLSRFEHEATLLPRERARRIRYLQGRGFNHEHIQYAMSRDGD